VPGRRVRGIVVVAVLSYVLANQTQVGWVYLVSTTLTAALLLSFLAPLCQGRWITAETRVLAVDGRDLHAERPAVLAVVVRATMPSFLVQVTQRAPLDMHTVTFARWLLVLLAPGRAMTLRKEWIPRQRGYVDLLPPTIRSASALGIVSGRRETAESQRLLVYPAYIELSRAPWGHATNAEVANRGRAGHGTDLHGARDYRYGDALRNISWRSTARHQRLIVKEMEDPGRAGFGIVLDLEGTTEGTLAADSPLEYAVKVAATYAYAAHLQHRKVRLFGAAEPPFPAEALDWTEIRTCLALTSATATVPLYDVLARIRPLGQMLVVLRDTDETSRAILDTWIRDGIHLSIGLLITSTFDGSPRVSRDNGATHASTSMRRTPTDIRTIAKGQSLASIFGVDEQEYDAAS